MPRCDSSIRASSSPCFSSPPWELLLRVLTILFAKCQMPTPNASRGCAVGCLELAGAKDFGELLTLFPNLVLLGTSGPIYLSKLCTLQQLTGVRQHLCVVGPLTIRVAPKHRRTRSTPVPPRSPQADRLRANKRLAEPNSMAVHGKRFPRRVQLLTWSRAHPPVLTSHRTRSSMCTIASCCTALPHYCTPHYRAPHCQTARRTPSFSTPRTSGPSAC